MHNIVRHSLIVHVLLVSCKTIPSFGMLPGMLVEESASASPQRNDEERLAGCPGNRIGIAKTLCIIVAMVMYSSCNALMLMETVV